MLRAQRCLRKTSLWIRAVTNCRVCCLEELPICAGCLLLTWPHFVWEALTVHYSLCSLSLLSQPSLRMCEEAWEWDWPLHPFQRSTFPTSAQSVALCEMRELGDRGVSFPAGESFTSKLHFAFTPCGGAGNVCVSILHRSPAPLSRRCPSTMVDSYVHTWFSGLVAVWQRMGYWTSLSCNSSRRTATASIRSPCHIHEAV